MTVKIGKIDRFKRLAPGQTLELKGTRHRTVRLELNCPEPTIVEVEMGGGLWFLAKVDGHEIVEFAGDGDLVFYFTTDADVYYACPDGDRTAISRPDAVSFTKIVGRRARNPELERLQLKMMQNMDRRFEQQRRELEQLRTEYANPVTGEVHEDGDAAPERVQGAPEGETGDVTDAPDAGKEPAPAPAPKAKTAGK